MRGSLICSMFSLVMAHIVNAESVSFLSCPIARDTGPDSDVCFFTEYQGREIALIPRTPYNRPELKHKILVEGELIPTKTVCGGVGFKGSLSILPELSPECDEIRPHDGSPAGKRNNLFHRMPEKHRERAFALMERAKSDPSASLEAAIYDPDPTPEPQPPFFDQHLSIYFSFNQVKSSGPELIQLLELIRYANAANETILLKAFQGKSKLDSGEILTEKPTMAEQRAQQMVNTLTGLGVSSERIKVTTIDAFQTPSGIDDWKQRRVEFTLSLSPIEENIYDN